jgi:hypothetical protein
MESRLFHAIVLVGASLGVESMTSCVESIDPAGRDAQVSDGSCIMDVPDGTPDVCVHPDGWPPTK